MKLESSLTRIEELEKESDEKVLLYKKIDELSDREKDMITELDKIRNKYLRMKAKIRGDNYEFITYIVIYYRINKFLSDTDKLVQLKKTDVDYDDMKTQKEYFEREYTKMLDKLSKSSTEVSFLNSSKTPSIEKTFFSFRF